MTDFVAKLEKVPECPPQECTLRDYSKLARNLERLRKGTQLQKQPVVLLSTGSLCPVHTGHVNNFIYAKQSLERAHLELSVVAGFLSPTHDGYVMRKYGHDERSARAAGWLTAQQRLELVKLAVADSAFIAADAWEVSQEEFVNWPRVAECLQEELAQEFPECGFLYLCGEDVGGSLVRHGGYSETLKMCAVTRTSSSDAGKPALECGEFNGNYIVKGGQFNVSSTKVRECFQDEQWDDAKCLLHTQVYLRLRKMGYATQLRQS